MPDDAKTKTLEDAKRKTRPTIDRGRLLDEGLAAASKGEAQGPAQGKAGSPFPGGTVHYGARPFCPPPVYGMAGAPFLPFQQPPAPGWQPHPEPQQRGPEGPPLFEKIGGLMKTGADFLNAALAGGLQMMNAFGARAGACEEPPCHEGHGCCGYGYDHSRCRHGHWDHSCCGPCVRGC